MNGTVRFMQAMAGYAAKFAAETIGTEGVGEWEPTDRNLAHVLHTCVRPPQLSEYPAIRDHFNKCYRSKS